MFTITDTIVAGSSLPGKGRILLTNSPAFLIREYTQTILLFNNPSNSSTSNLSFMPDDALFESLEILIRDHYAPFTGWIEVKGIDLYLTWDNYKDGIYSPKYPIQFETSTINTSYDNFYKMVQDGDPSLHHSRSVSFHSIQGRDEPLIFVKVTRLEPDNQAVAVNLHCSHMAMDGCSATSLFENWSSLYCQIQNDPTIMSSLDYKIPHPPLFGTPDFSKFRALGDKEAIGYADNKIDGDSANTPIHMAESEGINDCCIYIPENKQKEIRDEAHKSGVSFNTYLFSILWKEGVDLQFRQLPEIIDNVSSLGVAINIRPEFDIPMDLCSSAIFVHHIKIKVKSILEMSAIEIAQVIKKKLKLAISRESICNHLDNAASIWRGVCQEGGDIFERFSMWYKSQPLSAPTFIITSLLNFNLPGVDFGSGGPVSIRLPITPIPGFISITPKNHNTKDNGIQVYFNLPKECSIKDSSVLSELVA